MTEYLVKKLGLRVRVFLFFALIAVISSLAIILAGYFITTELALESVAPLVLYGGIAIFLSVGLTTWVWFKFDENVAQPLLVMINDMQAATHAGSTQSLTPGVGKYLGFLAPSVDQAMSALTKARTEVSEEVQSATEDANRLKRRLETVLRDLQEGVVICRLDHTILLYNKQAQIILTPSGEVEKGPGLGRSLSAFLAEWPLQHCLERLQRRHETGRYLNHRDGLMIPLTTLAKSNDETLLCRMSLILEESDNSPRGYVITITKATAELEAGIWRDRILSSSIREMRQRLTNVALVAETILNVPDIPADERKKLLEHARTEPEQLNSCLDKLDEVAADLLAGAWPTSPINSGTLFDCVASRLSSMAGIEVNNSGKAFWLECESASLVGLLSLLIEKIAKNQEVKSFNLAVSSQDNQSYLNVDFEGTMISIPQIEIWLQEPIDSTLGDLTGKDVLNRYKTEIWSESIGDNQVRLRMPITISNYRDSEAEQQINRLPARPEFYDFELFSKTVSVKQEDTLLTELDMVVFDTETTGLEPSHGDEVISIAGVRVVNGRVLSGEYFDRLVNPERSIPLSSTKVHHITEKMVEKEPTIKEILPLFHTFVDGAVLVAHNAPFDMAFLNKYIEKTGVEFSQTSLDTVLLAAHVFGSTEDLTLDAIAQRLSVEIDSSVRHSALGDSIATATVLIGLIKILEQHGVRTFGDAINVSLEQLAIRRRQKKY